MGLFFRTILDPNNNGNGTTCNGINDNGEIVGIFVLNGHAVGFDDKAGIFTTLFGPPSSPAATFVSANGINDSGQIVGDFTDASGSHGFLLSGGVYTTLTDPNAKATGPTDANGISNDGFIVGDFTDNANKIHGFFYTGGTSGTFSTIDVPASVQTIASGISTLGAVVGSFVDAGLVTHGFAEFDGQFTTIDVPHAVSTRVLGINDNGQMVGTYSDMTGQHGFLLSGGSFTRFFGFSGGTFTTFDDPNGSTGTTTAFGINNNGRIVGQFITSGGPPLNGFETLPGPDEPVDLLGTGFSGVVWRNTNGTLATWQMNGGAISSSGLVTSQGQAVTPDQSWSEVGIGTFATATADLLWRQSTTGSLAVWTMTGSAVVGSGIVTSGGQAVTPDASWSVNGVANFFGGAHQDAILWRQTTGALVVWSMQQATIRTSATITSQGQAVTPDASWSVAGTGDFNGDGMSDILWRQNTGALAMWQMNGATVTKSAAVSLGGSALAPDASWSVAGVGDFNGDGSADLLWRQTTGALAIWDMNGASVVSSAKVTFKGQTVTPDASWSIVEIGDFTGNGNDDILWRQSSTGMLSEWIMNGSQITSTATPAALGTAVSPDASWSVQGNPNSLAGAAQPG